MFRRCLHNYVIETGIDKNMEKLQAALTEFVMEHAHIEHEANLCEFKDEPTGKVFQIANSLIVGLQPKVYAVYTLGSISSNVF